MTDERQDPKVVYRSADTLEMTLKIHSGVPEIPSEYETREAAL